MYNPSGTFSTTWSNFSNAAQVHTISPVKLAFVDVATAAGISDASHDDKGAFWGDFDNDGYDDLYVTTYGTNKLYHNNGNGTFTDVTTTAGVGDTGAGFGATWGDFDEDGYLDLYVANYGQGNKLYLNNGDGTFTDVTSTAGVGNTGFNYGALWFDFDSDGSLDLCVTDISGQSIKLYRNNRNGTFTDVSTAAGVDGPENGVGLSWGDYDNDGHHDLFVASAGNADKLFRSNGDGTFTEEAVAAGVASWAQGFGPAWGDFDNDGNIDLFVANKNSINLLYRNNGDGTFADVTAAAGVGGDGGNSRSASWVDFDGDGDLDLSVVNYGSANKLYRNNGDDTFTDVASIAGVGDTGSSMASAWGDFDGDGDLDLYVANSYQANKLYRYAQGVLSPTLVVKPVKTTGDAPSIFGFVELTTADGTLVALRPLRGGSGHGGQDR